MEAHRHQSARVAPSTILGHFTVIGKNVSVGENCTIGNNVVVHAGTVIGKNVRIDDCAVIGKLPMVAAASALKKKQDLEPTTIADGCLIGTHAVIYRGASLGKDVLVADLATVRELVTIGERTIIGRGVAVESNCRIGANCKLETNAYITAFSLIEDDCFVAPGVKTSNDANIARHGSKKPEFKGITLRRGARLGVGATVLPGLEVASEAVIAAGALLTKDALAGKIYCGVPAKIMRDVPPEQLLKKGNKRA